MCISPVIIPERNKEGDRSVKEQFRGDLNQGLLLSVTGPERRRRRLFPRPGLQRRKFSRVVEGRTGEGRKKLLEKTIPSRLKMSGGKEGPAFC